MDVRTVTGPGYLPWCCRWLRQVVRCCRRAHRQQEQLLGPMGVSVYERDPAAVRGSNDLSVRTFEKNAFPTRHDVSDDEFAPTGNVMRIDHTARVGIPVERYNIRRDGFGVSRLRIYGSVVPIYRRYLRSIRSGAHPAKTRH